MMLTFPNGKILSINLSFQSIRVQSFDVSAVPDTTIKDSKLDDVLMLRGLQQNKMADECHTIRTVLSGFYI